MDEAHVEWTEYMRYRSALRRFDIARIEEIVRYSSERYVDSATGRFVVVGRHAELLIMVPYEAEGDMIRPITSHVITRAQIEARIKSGRFTHE
jgi:hypothetical protein